MSGSEATPVFDLAEIASEDAAEMDVRHPATSEPTGWKITFAGPSHPRVRESNDRAARKRLHDDRQREMAQINGKKWKPAERSVDDVREENCRFVADRILGWSPVRINGQDYPYSDDNAMKLLRDPKYGSIFAQSLEFLNAADSFTRASATT